MSQESGVHHYPLGIVGNCPYIARVDDEAVVRWLRLPRFDSSFVLGSLLDPDKGGEFSIRPLIRPRTQETAGLAGYGVSQRPQTGSAGVLLQGGGS